MVPLVFWNAMGKDIPGHTQHQRCCVHKTGNVLASVSKGIELKAKVEVREV
ncbi:MAG: hypothetical protein ACTS73_07015 [Arsenophonus sp. NEOnobi-MAG3]